MPGVPRCGRPGTGGAPAHTAHRGGRPVGRFLELVTQAVDAGFDAASGRFLSYIPSGALYSAALGTYLGAVINRYTAAGAPPPGMVAIEESVIRWMTSLFGFGDGAGGVLLSGGSLANLTAVLTARSRLGERFDDGVVYTSERTHHSMTKGSGSPVSPPTGFG